MPCRLWFEVNPPGKFRLRLSHRRIVEVLLVGPLPDLRDLGVVDLDLVVDLVDGEGRPGRHYKERGGTDCDNAGGAKLRFQIPVHCYIRWKIMPIATRTS